MEFHKLVHRVFLFGMFLVCCLAVISLAYSRVQASLSAATISPSSTIQIKEDIESLSSATQTTISTTNTGIKNIENTVKEEVNTNIESSTKTESVDSAKTEENTTIKNTDVVSTAEARMKTSGTAVKTDESEKLDDVETMKQLLLTDTVAKSSDTETKIESTPQNNSVDSSLKETEKTLEENVQQESDESKVLNGQVFAQPTVILAAELEKEKNPKLSGDVNADLSIGNVELVKKYDGQKSLLFSGKVEPNASFNIFIFSKDPVVMTIKADDNGYWSYEMTKDLADGQHEVYIAVTERDGRIVKKSQPFAFVKTAEAATSIPVSELDEYKSPMQRSTASYITIAVVIISVCLAVALALIGILNHKHKTDETII